MIKYSLVCKDCNTIFDSWFKSSADFEKLKDKNFLNCHNCNSLNIHKSLMKPNIVNKKSKLETKDFKNKNINFKKKIREYQNFVKKNFDYVGDNFAYEARSIHYNDKKRKKGIFGSASKKDVRELKEEGIDTQIIPWFKTEDN